MKYIKLANVLAIILFCGAAQARSVKETAEENCKANHRDLVCQTNCETSQKALKTVREYCIASGVEGYAQRLNEIPLKWHTMTGFSTGFSMLFINVLTNNNSNKTFDSIKKEFNTLKKEYSAHKIEFKKVQDAHLILNPRDNDQEEDSIVSIEKHIVALDIMLKNKESFNKFREAYTKEMEEFPNPWGVSNPNNTTNTKYKGKTLSKELCLYLYTVNNERQWPQLKQNLGYTCEGK